MRFVHLLQPVFLGLCPVCWLCIVISVLALCCAVKLIVGHIKRGKETCEED